MNRLHYSALCFACSYLTWTGCTESSHGAIDHPQSSNIVNLKSPTVRTSLRTAKALTSHEREFQRDISLRTLLTIGALETPPEQVFGQIADIDVDPVGRIFVLDSRAGNVRVFDFKGRLIGSFGRPGRGPGELANPLSLTLGPDGEILVSDLTRQVHVFRGRDFQYVRSFQIDISGLDMCMLGRRLIVHGVNLTENRLIHVYDLSGKPARSFGSVYHSTNPDVNVAFSRGRIVCEPESGLVLFVPRSGLPEVIAYDTSGTVQWVETIDQYRPIRVFEVDRGYGVEVPPGGFHRVETFTRVQPGYVILQLALVTRESQADGRTYVQLSTILIRAASGTADYLGDSLPPISALGPSLVVEKTEDPFPQLKLYDRTLPWGN